MIIWNGIRDSVWNEVLVYEGLVVELSKGLIMYHTQGDVISMRRDVISRRASAYNIPTGVL